MLNNVYKEQILKIIELLNKDIKDKQEKISRLETENINAKEDIRRLSELLDNSKKEISNISEQTQNMNKELQEIQEIKEKELDKFVKLEDEISQKDEIIESYMKQKKASRIYNLIIWILLIIVIILQIYLWFK